MSGFLRKMKRKQGRMAEAGSEAKELMEVEKDIREALSRLEMDVTLARETRAWSRIHFTSPHQVVIVVTHPDHAEAMGLDTFDAERPDRRSNIYGKGRFRVEMAKGFVTGQLKGRIGAASADALRQGGMKWSVALIGCRNGLWEALAYKLPTGETADTAEEMGPDELHEFG